LRLQAIGNDLIKLLGARSVHPVGACVGGFYQAPDPNQVTLLIQKLETALADAYALLKFLSTLPKKHNTQEFMCVSLSHPNEYPMNEGRIVSDAGLDISANEFENHFEEFQVPYSTALHCKLNQSSYLVGPLSRVNNNFSKLPDELKKIAQDLGFNFPSKNMFDSIAARALEIYYAIYEAKQILMNYALPKASTVKVTARAGNSAWATEAPRGLLWKRYEIDENGLVKHARIVPPTSQNQMRIEEDLNYSLTQFGLTHSDQDLRAYAEMLIRNYDPCISCSTHFLDLRVERL
jgi:coenzyme F420-reducing hydrogenase alpha subunit